MHGTAYAAFGMPFGHESSKFLLVAKVALPQVAHSTPTDGDDSLAAAPRYYFLTTFVMGDEPPNAHCALTAIPRHLSHSVGEVGTREVGDGVRASHNR